MNERTLFAAMSLLLATGCAPYIRGHSGPYTVTLSRDPAWTVAHCENPHARGCTRRWGQLVETVCPIADADCQAHEMHHACDPTWRHE